MDGPAAPGVDDYDYGGDPFADDLDGW